MAIYYIYIIQYIANTYVVEGNLVIWCWCLLLCTCHLGVVPDDNDDMLSLLQWHLHSMDVAPTKLLLQFEGFKTLLHGHWSRITRKKKNHFSQSFKFLNILKSFVLLKAENQKSRLKFVFKNILNCQGGVFQGPWICIYWTQ